MADKKHKKQREPTTPGDGERRATRGMQNQYRRSATLIYTALQRNELRWIGVADPSVGILDDLVVGLGDKVVGHQYKSSQFPEPFRLKTLLIGANGILSPLIGSWKKLKAKHPDSTVEVRFLMTDYPSISDQLVDDDEGPSHSAVLLAEMQQHAGRSLANWQATKWATFFDELQNASGIDEITFSDFLSSTRIVCIPNVVNLGEIEGTNQDNLINDISDLLPKLVTDASQAPIWTREALLKKLGWSDAVGRRRGHAFPIGEYVQRNEKSEKELLAAIATVNRGYICVLGPPGTGKSTLLQSGIQATSNIAIIRYFAFLPGESHGLGRAEAEDFLFDLVGELKRSGLQGTNVQDGDIRQAREQFEHLLKKASERYQARGTKTVIIVDGLDHVPREETPIRSLLCELPRADAVPLGVLFVLGSQHLNLDGLQTSASSQAAETGRCINIDPLTRSAIGTLANTLGIDVEKYADAIFTQSKGHPLAAHYIIEALKKAATESDRSKILEGEFSYDGDIKRIYEAAWKDFASDQHVRKVLGYVARSEGPISPGTLSELVSEDAVERAYASTRHLLNTVRNRWSVFHNSFRLFILSKQEFRIGQPDLTYGMSIYRDLAKAASKAEKSDPQSWLELRYHDKASDTEKLIGLAKPDLFRAQLANGRPIGEIQIDIRLAFKAIKEKHDTVKIFELVLARHELDRRANVLSEAESIVDTYKQLGDFDRARALISERGPTAKSYDVIDELVEAGRIDEARALFEEVEPLAHADPYIVQQESELEAWAARVHLFRENDQIIATIDKITAKYPNDEKERKQRADNLRFEVASSAMFANYAASPHDIASALELDPDCVPYLAIEASIAAWEDGDATLSSQQLSVALPSVLAKVLSTSWRRRVSRQALRLGDLETARAVFKDLETPSIVAMSEAYSDPSARSIAWTTIEHFALCTALGEIEKPPAESKHAVHNSFQSHLVKLGRLLGHAWKGDTGSYLACVAAVQGFILFLNNVSYGSADNSYRVSQIVQSAPLIVEAITQIGRLYGAEAYSEIQKSFDEAIAKPVGHFKAIHIQQKIALSAFKLDGDQEKASRRLENAIPTTADENTPAEQVEAIASFAKAFAIIGQPDRALAILTSIHTHTLGYEIAAKKDPQYLLWRDVFERACAGDPALRKERLICFCRLLSGMSKTEGSGAAYRLTSTALKQAAMEDARVAAATMEHLLLNGLVSWTGLLNSVLCGLVTRRPDLSSVIAHLWTRLVLPFYTEPHYHESNTGAFVQICIENVVEAELAEMVQLFSQSIETESGDDVRTSLFERLIAAAEKRGHSSAGLKTILKAWLEAAPVKRDSSSESDDEILVGTTNLKEVEEKLPSGGDALDYRSTDRLSKIIEKSLIDETLTFIQSRSNLITDSRLRFKVAASAIDQGRPDAARTILKDYNAATDERSYWTPWYGGAKLEYHKLLVALDGKTAREQAAIAFADDLSRGRENILSLLPRPPRCD